jgi:hypothetical protein
VFCSNPALQTTGKIVLKSPVKSQLQGTSRENRMRYIKAIFDRLAVELARRKQVWIPALQTPIARTTLMRGEQTMSKLFTEGHAIVIGVGHDLPNTIDDAEGLAKILKDKERCAYPAKQVKLLTGENATRDKIIAALESIAESATADSSVIVYFSGHGYRVKTSIGTSYFLMPYGYNTQKLAQTAISGAEFATLLKAIKSQKLLLLLDCCHAGGFDDAKAPGLTLSKAPLPPEAQALLAEGNGRVVIASSKSTELSYAGKPYSAFTLALIEALNGAGASEKDGYVRVTDLALYTREVVPARTQKKQHPILHFKQADNFIVAYYAAGDTEPKGLPIEGKPQLELEPGVWTTIDIDIRFYQPNMKVEGDQYVAGRDMVFNNPKPRRRRSTAGRKPVTGTQE